MTNLTVIRNDWTEEQALEVYNMPFNDLLFKASSIHRENFDPNELQLSTLYNVKVGGCEEDCSYCAQSSHNDTGVKAEKIVDVEEVYKAAQQAKEIGASRFCMSAAWKNPKARDLPKIKEMISKVKSLGLETCTTLGMLTKEQAQELRSAGLDYYNHNVDTSRDHYKNITTTRTYDDRLETLKHASDSGIKLCTGGIIGMGEEIKDRTNMLVTLANLPEHPQSVPINVLTPIKGTPLEDAKPIDVFDLVRMIATARIIMPATYIRLSSGRSKMSDSTQALCYFAGANSTFIGDKLLTTGNPSTDKDRILFDKLNLKSFEHRESIPDFGTGDTHTHE